MDPIIAKGVAEAPFPNTYSTGVLDATRVIRAHIPSITDKDEAEIAQIIPRLMFGVVDADIADLALRTCSCGIRIDGLYGYQDHLLAVLGVTP